MYKEESISETNSCVSGVFGAGKSFLGSRHKLCLHLLLPLPTGARRVFGLRGWHLSRLILDISGADAGVED